MIGLSAPTADTGGAVLLKNDQSKTRINPPPSRLSRVKCLDGSVHIEHSGECDGDRTFIIPVPNVTEAQYTILKNLKKNYTSITIACSEGVFYGPIETLRVTGGTAHIKILVKDAYTVVD